MSTKKRCPTPRCNGKPKVMQGWCEDDMYIRRYRCPACGVLYRTVEVVVPETIEPGQLRRDDRQKELDFAA